MGKIQPYAMYMLESVDQETIGPLDWITVFAGRAIHAFQREDGWPNEQCMHEVCQLEVTRQNDQKVVQQMEDAESARQFYFVDRQLMGYMG